MTYHPTTHELNDISKKIKIIIQSLKKKYEFDNNLSKL